MRNLWRIRSAFAIALLLPAALGFLDFGRLLSPALASLVARVQLVPALLHLPARGAILALTGIAAATLLAGRLYCSTVCPLGTVQDLFVRLGDHRHRRGRYRFRYLRPRTGIHLALAILSGALAAGGATLALGLLEPWTAFGRMVSALGRPLVAAAVNGLFRALAAHHVYAVQPVGFPPFAWAAAALGLATLAGIGAIALGRGRLFCNLLCPAGALLRLLSRRTVFRIGIDGGACSGCGVCEKACKAGCIDASRRRVDFDACIGCLDCLAVCPKDGVRLEAAFARQPRAEKLVEELPDPGRRAVLRAAALAPAALLAPPSARAAPSDPRDARAPLMPPGSIDLRQFGSRCTACQLCVAACPAQVVRPSFLEYGVAGLLRPRLVYDDGSCVYDCLRCGEVCPTGAIQELSLSEKRLVQVGRARFVKADCVVETKKKACGACAEHCPTKALAMVPYGEEPGLKIPEVNEEACIGCGACEHPCPTTPRKAIFVEARSPHGRAKPIEQKPLEKPAGGGEFPF
ncbi:MAG TPA: 4Fe-4S dicluster domain-containing protein [Anaeromyxobacter sp.]|nr:4Fe-4S dicluster domain-containing protein [Anaeromyxobacter sp.]